MAARRLIFVMIVMLMLSSFAAALVPVRNSDDETTTTTKAAKPKPPEPRTRLVTKRIDTAAKEQKTIRVAPGDHLVLRVRSNKAGVVEIPALGELDDVEPETPALFDLLPFKEGAYDVLLVGSDRRLGQIVVNPRPPPEEKGAKKPQSGQGEPATSV